MKALQSVNDLSIKNVIITPKYEHEAESEYFDIPESLETRLYSIYNKSQFDAIKQSLKKEGITLIQGPPGTGKTTTILGVLSVLFHSRNETEKLVLVKQ